MKLVLTGLHAANPGAEIESAPADPKRRKKAEISCEQPSTKKPSYWASNPNGREPGGQPFRCFLTFSLVYTMFVPNNPDASMLSWKYLREKIDYGKEDGESCNKN